jgi:hypothetical protein
MHNGKSCTTGVVLSYNGKTQYYGFEHQVLDYAIELRRTSQLFIDLEYIDLVQMQADSIAAQLENAAAKISADAPFLAIPENWLAFGNGKLVVKSEPDEKGSDSAILEAASGACKVLVFAAHAQMTGLRNEPRKIRAYAFPSLSLPFKPTYAITL